jgi:hypothetical protein
LKKPSKFSLKGRGLRYSELYQNWKGATVSGKKDEADKLGVLHSKQFLGKQYTENMELLRRQKGRAAA